MKTRIVKNRNQFVGVETYEGETIEMKVARVVNNNEPITDGAPIIYTEKKDGVMPDYNVRTDRWDIAIEAMDKVNKAEIAKSLESPKIPDKPEEGSPGVN
ncbi:MAG: hypothetical protein [Microviridae sp.]|nr:MAG: hypothetical protein [Microviridae sp.]